MGIRRWLSGTLRPDRLETDEVKSESATVNGKTTTEALEAGSVNTDDVSAKRQSGSYRYVASYDGGTPDERLDAAIADASDGDVLVLAAEEYSGKTVNKRLGFEGTVTTQTKLSGTWDFQSRPRLSYLRINGTVELNDGYTTIHDIELNLSEFNVNANHVTLTNILGNGTVTFASGTAGGSIGSRDGRIGVTDNGSNRVI